MSFFVSTAVHHGPGGGNLPVFNNYIPSAQLAKHTVARPPISIEDGIYEIMSDDDILDGIAAILL